MFFVLFCFVLSCPVLFLFSAVTFYQICLSIYVIRYELNKDTGVEKWLHKRFCCRFMTDRQPYQSQRKTCNVDGNQNQNDFNIQYAFQQVNIPLALLVISVFVMICFYWHILHVRLSENCATILGKILALKHWSVCIKSFYVFFKRRAQTKYTQFPFFSQKENIKTMKQKWQIHCYGWSRGKGYSHYKGMCRSNGLLFHKKSLKWVQYFYKNIPKHGYQVFKSFGVLAFIFHITVYFFSFQSWKLSVGFASVLCYNIPLGPGIFLSMWHSSLVNTQFYLCQWKHITKAKYNKTVRVLQGLWTCWKANRLFGYVV